MNVSTETTAESKGGLHELPPSDPPAPPTAEEIDTLLGLIQKDARPYVKMLRDGIDPWDAIVAMKRVEHLEAGYQESVEQLAAVTGPIARIEEKFEAARVKLGLDSSYSGDPEKILDHILAGSPNEKKPQSEDGKKLEEAVRSIAQQTHGVNPRNYRGGKVYDVTVPEEAASLMRIVTGVATT